MGERKKKRGLKRKVTDDLLLLLNAWEQRKVDRWGLEGRWARKEGELVLLGSFEGALILERRFG